MLALTAKTKSLNWNQLKEEIRHVASALGIDKIGFASADPFLDLKERLYDQRNLNFQSGFEYPDIEKRVDPERIFQDPRSIISIAVAYPSKLMNAPKSFPGAYRGVISRSAWGEDYHRVLANRLERLDHFIKERVEGARSEMMVDTGALVDRGVAERAGVGWSGKNCATITPEWGSWVFLGEMITNLPFPPDTPITDGCGDCTICIDACPTGALVQPGQLNASKCISFITQTKGEVDDWLKSKMGNRLYGCDTCQIVCPVNKGLNWTHNEEFQADPEKAKPLLAPLLTMSNSQFKQTFGRSAASWRGKKPIQRNAIIALGHFKDVEAVPLLIKLLSEDERPVIRSTAAWSLGRIGGDAAKQAISERMVVEKDGLVQTALMKANGKLELVKKEDC